MHLLARRTMGIVERCKRAFRPAMTFREQRHSRKYGRGGGGESDADFHITGDAEAPFERGARIGETSKIGRPFGRARQARPFGASLFEPPPVIGRVTHCERGEFGVVDADFEGVSACRV
jgi:hypothetical protein